ncbi:MAG TPA: SigE family RNA polymerase sigma factor [Casimicrobiaceae bacterium]|nr:SigE family RNA polymerase sigma factor [Casimicrobiaceae bacterium]
MTRDQPSLDEFVAARGDALVRFAYVLTGGDLHQAEDLVQSALAKVLGRWSRICAGGQPEAYLRRAVVTGYLSYRRRRSSTEVVTSSLPERAADDGFATADAQDAAWRLIAGLPKRQRAVLALRYLEDWPDEQIAAACQCSTGTVRSQASRALATLRAQRGPAWTIAAGSEDHA